MNGDDSLQRCFYLACLLLYLVGVVADCTICFGAAYAEDNRGAVAVFVKIAKCTAEMSIDLLCRK